MYPQTNGGSVENGSDTHLLQDGLLVGWQELSQTIQAYILDLLEDSKLLSPDNLIPFKYNIRVTHDNVGDNFWVLGSFPFNNRGRWFPAGFIQKFLIYEQIGGYIRIGYFKWKQISWIIMRPDSECRNILHHELWEKLCILCNSKEFF